MSEVWGDVLRAAGATERLMELLHADPLSSMPAAPQALPQPGQAAIRFEHVTFRYPSRPQTAALDDISLDVAPGESVALVGPSGAGKTTLFQLLLRFYDAQRRRASASTGRTSASSPCTTCATGSRIVPQDPVIFSANALENIRYGRPSASDEEVIACRQGWRWRMNSSRGCRRATKRSWASAACACPAGSASASRSRARC